MILVTGGAGFIGSKTLASGIRKPVQWYLDNAERVRGVQSGAYKDWIGTNYGEFT